MNSLIQSKTTILPLLIAGVLACFGLSPNAEAVSPPPDGGYPGGNTAEGQSALFSRTTGGFNTAVGFLSLRSNTTGSFNTAIGAGTLPTNTGDQNTATGAGALLLNTGGTNNTANGVFALYSNTNGTGNTALGDAALQNDTTGSDNIALGFGAGSNVTTASNVSGCFIGNIRGVTTINNDAIPVLIDSAGQLGTMSSSRRFKKEIEPMDKASEAILALKPVSFRYKVHKDMTPQFGLIAEDVAKVNPDLVIYDGDGKPYTVRYDAVNAMLLNEFLKEHRAFLKEHRKVEEQEATITQLKRDFQSRLARQQKQIEALTTGLQKVSAQLEVSKPAPQTVLNQ